MNPGGVRPRILIVEDEAITAADLQESIQRLGYESVGIVNSGAKAVDAAREQSPDVVLMDVSLKGTMDGVAAAEAILKNWNIPVVFITGNPNQATLMRASAAGAYGYILKPFRPTDLNATILVALQQHSLVRELFSERTWLRTVLESLNDGVIATDVEGYVRYLNHAAQELTGYSVGEALGRPIEELYRLTTMCNEPVGQCQLRRALSTKAPVRKGRFLMHAWDGRIIAIEDAASPIESAGQVIGAVTVLVDITERLRGEDELAVERERLEEEMHQTSQQLGETRGELLALSGQLIQAQEEERKRVARELHDDLNQRAAIAGMELERIEPLLPPGDDKAHHFLREARQHIARLSAGLREVSHRLHPGAVEDLGLGVALRMLVDEYREHGVDVSFVRESDARELSREAATALYRIAQESLRNAWKHAPGAPVRVILEEAGGELRLQIEDAGPGFEREKLRGKRGLGLLSMEERVRLIGGILLVRSKPGYGTTILVRVPIPHSTGVA